MKILLEDIPEEGLSLDIQEKFEIESHSLVSPVSAHLDIYKTGPEVIINGRLVTELEFQCSRCLKNFNRHMDVNIDLVYHPLEEITAERHALKDDEMETGFYTGAEIDLQDVLKEQILLNINMKPLCDDNCRGICPQCGNDLNKQGCSCEKKEVDPRFQVLKQFLEKRKE